MLKVLDIMTREVFTLSADASAEEAAWGLATRASAAHRFVTVGAMSDPVQDRSRGSRPGVGNGQNVVRESPPAVVPLTTMQRGCPHAPSDEPPPSPHPRARPLSTRRVIFLDDVLAVTHAPVGSTRSVLDRIPTSRPDGHEPVSADPRVARPHRRSSADASAESVNTSRS